MIHNCNPLSDKKAKEYCMQMIKNFDTYGVEQCVLTNFLKNKNAVVKKTSLYAAQTQRPKGQMFGVLVCVQPSGKEVVLRAFSGQFNSAWYIEGFVPPLLDEKKYLECIKNSDVLIHEITDKIKEAEKAGASETEIQKLKEKRHAMSKQSMKEIFDLYEIPVIEKFETVSSYEWTNPLNQKKYTNYITEPKIVSKKIFDFWNNNLPPTGAGECCAPKLLAYALNYKLRPVSLAEFYYGQPNNSGTKIHKQFYPPCLEKCMPILPSMLGLKILYQDEDLVVIDKPSGLLSVPGRGENKQDSVVARLRYLFPDCIEQPSVHRLDMETSGIMVYALNQSSHRMLQQQFEHSLVKKKYRAVLEHRINPGCCVTITERDREQNVLSGIINIKARLDVENRPHQIYDEFFGKCGITEFRVLNQEKPTLVEFVPKTGRTHQLRIASAFPQGLNASITGDSLYGTNATGVPDGSLKLDAFFLEFTHPVLQQRMQFCREKNLTD